MNKFFHLRIITVEKTVFDGSVSYLSIPGEAGFAGILAHHASLIAPLVPGPITIVPEQDPEPSVLNSTGKGILEFFNNTATVILDSAPSVS
ncbi:MAG: hypothetical protein PHE58_00860 [Candidatus Omnitrophica bacterium]|nr:hypothetical protein [Candidatus Omnitrophota bacterium]